MLGEDDSPGVAERVTEGFDLVGKAADNMLDKSYQRCIEANEPERVLLALSLEHHLALIGGAGVVDDRYRRCLTFELRYTLAREQAYFASGKNPSGHYRIRTTSTVGLELDEADFALEGSEPLTVVEQWAGGSGQPGVVGTTVGEPVEVLKLEVPLHAVLGRGPDGVPGIVAPDPGNPGSAPQFVLLMRPGSMTEHWVDYDGYGFNTNFYDETWRLARYREAERVPPLPRVTNALYALDSGWTLIGAGGSAGSLYATKTYDVRDIDGPSGVCKYCDHTVLEIHHTPQE